MIPSNIERAEKLKKEIDNALLRLADQKNRENYSFDFYSKFEQLLTITGVSEMMGMELRRYYSVIVNLYSFAGHFSQKIIRIRNIGFTAAPLSHSGFRLNVGHVNYTVETKTVELTYQYTWELYNDHRNLLKRFSKASTVCVFPTEYYNRKSWYDMQTTIQGYLDIPLYRYLLNGDDEERYKIDDVVEDEHKREALLKLFGEYGYNNAMPGVTFEKYINSLEPDVTPTDVTNETLTEVTEILMKKFPKIVWTGDVKQLYDIFRQMFKFGVIDNTKDEIAEFIGQHVQFTKVDGPNKNTILTELNREMISNRPMKAKRINLSDTEQ